MIARLTKLLTFLTVPFHSVLIPIINHYKFRMAPVILLPLILFLLMDQTIGFVLRHNPHHKSFTSAEETRVHTKVMSSPSVVVNLAVDNNDSGKHNRREKLEDVIIPKTQPQQKQWSPPMEETLDRLANKLQTYLEENRNINKCNQKQYWVAIAGGPGSGKTTVANAVADRLNRKFDDQDSVVAVIPMDGWHIPKDRLLEEFGEEGMKRRGAPWTFDAKKCFQDLKQAKEKKSASLPIYSREISDPVSNGVEINEKHRIIIVEGLYLLWKDDDDWRQVNSLFDEGWFVKCPTREEQINRLVQRSKATWSPDKVARWGPWPEGSIKRAKANDVKNMDLLDPCEQYADEIIFSHYNKA